MKTPGFIKRMILIIYDGLLLVGVTLVAYFPVYTLLSLAPDTISTGLIGNSIKLVFLLAASFTFYGWFWTHGGQTLGMRAWNLYLIDPQGKFPTWRTAAIRYTIALCSWGLVPALMWSAGVQFWYLAIGLGFTWMLINPARMAWHDILSKFLWFSY